VADHVQNVISSYAQTLNTLRLLREYGPCDAALQTVYRAVVVARLLYAASASPLPQTGSASRDFYAVTCVPVTTIKTSRCSPTWSKTQITSCSTGTSTIAATFCTHCFLTDARSCMPCVIADNFLLTCRVNTATDSNFITRQLFKDSY